MNKSFDRLKQYEEENKIKVAVRQQQKEKELLAKKKQAEEQHAARTQQRKEVAARLQQEVDKARGRTQARNAAGQQGRGRAHADSFIGEDLYRQCFEALSAAEYAANVPAPLRTKYTDIVDDRVQDQGRTKPALPPHQIPATVGRYKGKISSGPAASTANADGRHQALNNQARDVQSKNANSNSWKRPSAPERYVDEPKRRRIQDKYGESSPFTTFDSPTIPVSVKPVLPAPALQAEGSVPVSRGAIVRNQGNLQVQRQPGYPYVAPPHSVQYRSLPLREVKVKERQVHEIARDFGSHIPKNRKIVHETSNEYGEPLPGGDFLDDMTRYGWI
jgi:hypothetical protein